jgi:hypothetical protein
MPRASLAAHASPPSRDFVRHKSGVLLTLVQICENLGRLQSGVAARQACDEVAALLRDELRAVRRREPR